MLSIIKSIEKLRPDVTWKDGKIIGHTRETIAETYQSSQPLPSQAEIDDEVSIINAKNTARSTEIATKLAEIAQYQTHAQLEAYLDSTNVVNSAIRALFHSHWALLRKLNLGGF